VTGIKPRKNLHSAQEVPFYCFQTAGTIHRSSIIVTSMNCQRHLHWLSIHVCVVDFWMGVNSHLLDLSHLGSTRSMNTASSWEIKSASIKIERSGVILCLDRTLAHRIKVALNVLKKSLTPGFVVISETARSPKFSMLDAFVFPAIEHECNKIVDRDGTLTKADLRLSVAAI